MAICVVEDHKNSAADQEMVIKTTHGHLDAVTWMAPTELGQRRMHATETVGPAALTQHVLWITSLTVLKG